MIMSFLKNFRKKITYTTLEHVITVGASMSVVPEPAVIDYHRRFVSLRSKKITTTYDFVRH
jgi:hypothetical protein